jgi:hypothetical protein
MQRDLRNKLDRSRRVLDEYKQILNNTQTKVLTTFFKLIF